MKFKLLMIMFSFTLGCNKSGSSGGGGGNPVTPIDPLFAKGADISWLTQMEASGRRF